MNHKQLQEIRGILPRLNIMVVGDVMLDEYLMGHVRGISPEAPVPVVEIRERTCAPGGAGNVAANLASLGCNVRLCGAVGTDESAAKLYELFATRPHISVFFSRCQDRPTTTKTRILSQSQQMLRADREERHPISASAETELLQYALDHLKDLHACVLSDYAKGVLTDTLLHSLISMCREANIPVIVDPKGHHYSRYQGSSVVTPNTAEANLAVENEDGALTLEQVAARLQQEIGNGALLITRGPQGMSLFPPDAPSIHIAAQARTIYDVTGAGDTVVATLALMLASGLDLPDAAQLANYAAGIVVGKVGTACVTLDELLSGF